ncbi:GDSL esterase/lipase [Thalictrum thalictroides]|uniref:GDSL esterase/lipase n=1 Tax=Thalictrum thalictroides TaxID=46969 RepID=A0A7J6V357_THATH|nr:GDSL esterase/lipase [Thalictrum thalictroides]
MAVDATTVPAVFIFGDSTVDVGTNNHFNIPKEAKANYPPNGIDYPGSKATGRFSNGYNIADFLSQLMGFRKSPPPFLDLLDRSTLRLPNDIIHGANFASGAAEVLDHAGGFADQVFFLTKQIQQFATVRGNLTAILGPEATDRLLSKSIYFLSIGSNDILGFYLLNGTFNQEKFVATLADAYENHLRILYSNGARKFGIISVSAIGCVPAQRIYNDTDCVEDLNKFSQIFHLKMVTMLARLGSELKEMKYSLGNMYEMAIYFLTNAYRYNFTELASPCCGNDLIPCIIKFGLCPNRDEYLFWDWMHPTQAAAKLAAQTLYDEDPKFVTPIGLKKLAED